MGLFREPWVIVLIVVLVLLLFAAPKLPGFAKSLGQSMRIFRKEVKTMKDESAADRAADAPAAAGSDTAPATAADVERGDDAKPTA